MRHITLAMFLVIGCGSEEKRSAPVPAPVTPAAVVYTGPKVKKGDTKDAVKAIMGEPTSLGVSPVVGGTMWEWDGSNKVLCANSWKCAIDFDAAGFVRAEYEVQPDHVDVSSF